MKYIMLSSIFSYLQQKHLEYNKKFFKGMLSSIPFEESTSKKFIGLYVHKGGKSICFKFGKILNKNKDLAEIVLLHEMCHQAQIEISKDIKPLNKGHDKVWKMWMKKIGLTPPERYERAEGFDEIDIEHMTVDQILDALNEKRPVVDKENSKTNMRPKLNEEFAKKQILKLVTPAMKKLSKETKKPLDELLKIQKELMEEDFGKYIKMIKKFKIVEIPEKIELGLKRKWNVVMFNEVEKGLK